MINVISIIRSLSATKIMDKRFLLMKVSRPVFSSNMEMPKECFSQMKMPLGNQRFWLCQTGSGHIGMYTQLQHVFHWGLLAILFKEQAQEGKRRD